MKNLANSDLFGLPRRQLVLGSRVKIRRLACPILSASPAPRLSRGANERKARQSAGRINPGRVRRRETGAALMPGLSRRAPPTGHGEYEEVPPLLSKPPGQLSSHPYEDGNGGMPGDLCDHFKLNIASKTASRRCRNVNQNHS